MKNDTPLYVKYKEVYEFFIQLSKAGLYNKPKPLNNKYYHSIEKGCELINISGKSSIGNGIFINKRCKTHNVDVCQCGWQIHYHYGSHSLSLPKVERQLKDYHRGICKENGCKNPTIALNRCAKHYTRYNRKLAKYLKKRTYI